MGRIRRKLEENNGKMGRTGWKDLSKALLDKWY